MKIVAADAGSFGRDLGENPLFGELLAVHAMIRRDLEIVEVLARDAAGIAPAAEIRERVGELKAGTMLWHLRYGCINYCRFVHSHHRHEDVGIFPTLRRVDPGLDPVIDRLQADHRKVADLLTEVETAAEELDRTQGEAQRMPLVDALSRLREILLEHLAFEERSLESVLGRMKSWSG